jgi:hypothetical protein
MKYPVLVPALRPRLMKYPVPVPALKPRLLNYPVLVPALRPRPLNRGNPEKKLTALNLPEVF